MVNQLKNFGKKTLRLLMAFIAWVAIMTVTLNSILYFKTEHYHGTEKPNAQFQIVVSQPNNEPQAIYLKDFQNQVLVNPTKDIDWDGEDFLKKDNDTLTYHNEGAMWNTESKYKIVNQQIQPISFRLFTFVEAFGALILSLVFYDLLKYLIRKFIQNHKLAKTANNLD